MNRAIPDTLLIAAAPFGPRLGAAAVAAAIVRGVVADGSPQPEVCLLEADGRAERDPRAYLNAIGFDARMRASRAVVIAAPSLRERALAGSMIFEIATRARQAGVPAYAVTAENRLESFDARILDLQLVLPAGTPLALRSAGGTLALSAGIPGTRR